MYDFGREPVIICSIIIDANNKLCRVNKNTFSRLYAKIVSYFTLYVLKFIVYNEILQLLQDLNSLPYHRDIIINEFCCTN